MDSIDSLTIITTVTIIRIIDSASARCTCQDPDLLSAWQGAGRSKRYRLCGKCGKKHVHNHGTATQCSFCLLFWHDACVANLEECIDQSFTTTGDPSSISRSLLDLDSDFVSTWNNLPSSVSGFLQPKLGASIGQHNTEPGSHIPILGCYWLLLFGLKKNETK